MSGFGNKEWHGRNKYSLSCFYEYVCFDGIVLVGASCLYAGVAFEDLFTNYMYPGAAVEFIILIYHPREKTKIAVRGFRVLRL